MLKSSHEKGGLYYEHKLQQMCQSSSPNHKQSSHRLISNAHQHNLRLPILTLQVLVGPESGNTTEKNEGVKANAESSAAGLWG